MDDLGPIGLRMVGVLALVGANAFFVATEFALVAIRQTRMEEMAKEGNASAHHVLESLKNLDYYIAGTQVGITLASLMLGWIGEAAFANLFEQLFSFMPKTAAIASAHTLGVAVAFIIITFLHVVLGELVPKSVALQYPDETGLLLARPMRAAAWVMKPLIFALNGTGNLVLRLLGLPPSSGHGSVHSVEELRLLMEASHKEGVLEQGEKELLDRVFNMKDLVVRQVMVHRLDMDAIDVESELTDIRAIATKHPHSRYPVYRENLDHIVGLLHLKDIIIRNPAEEDIGLEELLRPVLWVPETLPVEQLMVQLRRARTQVAMVLDEFGGTSGMVTLQDVAEELLGELEDEFDPDDADAVNAAANGKHLVDGRTRLDELYDLYKIELDDEEVDTLAGYVIMHIGRVPEEGDSVVVDDLKFTVMTMDERRIAQVEIAGETPEATRRLLGEDEPEGGEGDRESLGA